VPKIDPLLEAVQQTLLLEWDPIGVRQHLRCRDEYDSYAPTICRYLREGADHFRLAAHLEHLQRSSMGLTRINAAKNLHVAQHLLELLRQTDS
jgi:hypothetical protein